MSVRRGSSAVRGIASGRERDALRLGAAAAVARAGGKGAGERGDGRAPCDMATTPMLRLVSRPFARASGRSIRRARTRSDRRRTERTERAQLDARAAESPTFGRGPSDGPSFVQHVLNAGRTASAPSRPTVGRASMDLLATASIGEGEGGGAGSGGKPHVKPPSQVRCPNCGHWKHPRSLSCKEPGCGCDCAKHQRGIRKKRQFAQIASSDGQWDGTVQRRLIHQVTLHPDSAHRSSRLPTKQQRRIPPNTTLPLDSPAFIPRPRAPRSSSRRS